MLYIQNRNIFFARLAFILWWSSFQSLVVDDISSTFSELTTAHNLQITESLPFKDITNFTTYAGFKVDEIVNLLQKDSWKLALDQEGDFSPLYRRLTEKLHSAKQANKEITLNILFIGGSVCLGHGCFPSVPNHTSLGISLDMFLQASFQCSWTHRFISFLQASLHRAISMPTTIHISPRYCCRAATSTSTGVDILLTKAYHTHDCKRYIHNGQATGSHTWEPDLVIWDYSVNDLHSQVRGGGGEAHTYIHTHIHTHIHPSTACLI